MKSHADRQSWAQHLGLWSFFLLMVSGAASLYEGDSGRALASYLLQLPAIMASAYLLFYGVYPRIQWRWPQVLWLGEAALIILGATLLNRLIMAELIYPWLYASDHSFEFWNWYRIANQGILLITAHALFGAFKYYKDFLAAQKEKESLGAQKKQAELGFLRAQMHPHFLFNSLNALYAELMGGKETAADTLLKLTNIYRFILEECKADQIPVEKEWKLIEDYASLEQKRYGQRLKLQLEGPGTTLSGKEIAPLILFSLVENAFKHGVSTQAGESFVLLRLEAKGKDLRLSIENSLYADDGNLNGHKTGIGLKNTLQQLDLVYGSRYHFEQGEEGGRFKTTLQIPLGT